MLASTRADADNQMAKKTFYTHAGICQDLLTLEERNLIDEQQRKRLLASNLRTRIFDKSVSKFSVVWRLTSLSLT